MSIIYADPYDSIPVTRWIDPYGRKPGTFEEWISANPYIPSFSAGIIEKVSSYQSAETVAIITNSRLYRRIDYRHASSSFLEVGLSPVSPLLHLSK